MGRPRIEIDGELVQEMASWGCKNEDIAEYFDCSTDTIERRFAGELSKGRSELRSNLRQWQLKAAKAGNVVMLIWLGKNYLNQKDKSDAEIDAIRAQVPVEMTQEKFNDLLAKARAKKGKA